MSAWASSLWEENGLWGDVNPCLIMVKHLSCGQPR
jgi:hypothetical protein